MGNLGLSFSSNPSASRTTLITPQVSGASSERGLADKGRHYLEGIGVPQNFAKAAQLLDKSALRGDPIGEYNLARMLFLGLGKQKDIERAQLLASMAAARGNLDAISLLSRIERKLATRDLGKLQQQAVTQWLKTDGGKLNEKTLIAKSGDLLTKRQLAWEHFHGVGLPRSYESTYFWANLAAAAGDHFARNLRDRIITNSTKGGLLTVTRITAAQSASLKMWEQTIGPAISRQSISKAVSVPTSVYNYLNR